MSWYHSASLGMTSLFLRCVGHLDGSYTTHKDKAASPIVHTLRVLRCCIDKLNKEYIALDRSLPDPPNDVLHPSPHSKAFRSTPSEYKLIYRCHMTGDPISNRPYFRADAHRGVSPPISCIVKFASRNGEEAHGITEREQAAVELLHCN